MNKKNLFYAIVAIAILVVIAVIAPKGGDNNVFTAGDGGLNLKELNEKSKSETSLSGSVSANATTEQQLFQMILIGSHTRYYDRFYLGGNMVGGLSTEFGVCTPVLYAKAGYNWDNLNLEYRMGNFKRSTIVTPMIDPQYSNYCIIMGEGAGVSNAMQLALTHKYFTFGFGHQGGSSFYRFNDGNWYAYTEVPVCKWLRFTGGADFGQSVSGFAAAKVVAGNNHITVTGNKLGTENSNVILSYARNNIAVGDGMLSVSASAWAKRAAQGIHLVTGLTKGKATLFAEAGLKYSNVLSPYAGLGGSFMF